MNTARLNLLSDATSPRMSASRVLRAYLFEAKHEFLRMLKTPGHVVPMLALPTLLYVLVGILVIGPLAAETPSLPLFMFSSFVVFGATTPGMFGFGVGLAVERQSGMLTLKRAQPMPAAANLVAKLCMSVACVAIVLAVLIPLGMLFGQVPLTGAQIVNIVSISLLGVTTFCAIGFFIGSVVSGSAATGVVNLFYFPMMYLSGMFFPLPEMLAKWAVIWPTFYMNQLIIAASGGESFMASEICIATLIGLAVLFGGLAIRNLTRG